MGATYLSFQCRTADYSLVMNELGSIASANPEAHLQFYVALPGNGWVAVFPNFTPEIEKTGKELSAAVECLVVLLLSADDDDLYMMFFRDGKQLPWLRIAAGKTRKGKYREKLANKLEVLAEVCDVESRARLVEILANAGDVIYSSDLLRDVCQIMKIPNAFTSFDYLQRGEREGLDPPQEPELITA